MRPPGNGAARLLSGAGLAAALLLPTALPAQAAPPSRVPAADGKKGQELPGMPSALDPEAEEVVCTPAPPRRRRRSRTGRASASTWTGCTSTARAPG
ncbi:hypothetical protein RKD45_005281 [Streptomyces griseus]